MERNLERGSAVFDFTMPTIGMNFQLILISWTDDVFYCDLDIGNSSCRVEVIDIKLEELSKPVSIFVKLRILISCSS